MHETHKENITDGAKGCLIFPKQSQQQKIKQKYRDRINDIA